MSHQALQNFQRYTGIQHVHRIGMAERVGDRNRTSHHQQQRRQPPPNPVLTVLSVTSQIRAFSVLPVRRLRRSMGIFSVATIVCSWLTYQSQRAEPAGESATGGHSPRRPGSFGPLFQGRKLHKRIRRRKRKSPRQRQCFINVLRCSTVASASCGADLGRNGAGHSLPEPADIWQFIMDHRHLAKCQSCRIINGNRQRCRLPGRIHCRYHDCRLAVYNGA